ncbi:MAG: hypothetical protein ACRDPE_23515 [Solirubrobacterales bacterium]
MPTMYRAEVDYTVRRSVTLLAENATDARERALDPDNWEEEDEPVELVRHGHPEKIAVKHVSHHGKT